MSEQPASSSLTEPVSGPPVSIAEPGVNGHAPDAAPTPDPDAESSSRIRELEAEVDDWQRRAVMWRDRALCTQSLNDVLSANLDDLRAMLQLRAPAATPESDRGSTHEIERASVEPWWTKVFRRETWASPR